jgi:hypothetical protein
MAVLPTFPSPYHVLLSHFAHFFLKTKGKRLLKYTGTYIGFEVFTVVVMKNAIFCDITLCSPLKVNQHFRGTYHLQLWPRRWMWYVPPKCQLAFNGVYGIISQKVVRFMLVSICQTAQYHIWEDHKNLKFYSKECSSDSVCYKQRCESYINLISW